MNRPLSALGAGLVGGWVLAAGCAASGSNQEIHGPAYGGEAGVDDSGPGDATAPVDAGGIDAEPREGAAPDGSGREEDGGAADAGGDNAASALDGSGGPEAGGCSSLTAILGGNPSSAFGATAAGAGPFSTQPIAAGLGTAPALVSLGGTFVGLLAEPGDASAGDPLYGIGFASGSWSAAVPLGGGAFAIDAPAIATVGATVQAAYLNPEHFYFHAAFTTGWDLGSDPVRPSDGGATAFGPVRPAAAGTATELVIAYEGSDGLPYAQTWKSVAGWDDGVALGSAALLPATPMAIAALDTGASDMVAVYVDGEGSASVDNLHLFFVLRAAANKTWSAPVMVNVNAYTEGAPSLTWMSGGRALVAWNGQSAGVYASVLTQGAAPTWSAPAAMTAASPPVVPSLAPGVCGDDAVAAYLSEGAAYTSRFSGGAWTAPAALAGAAGIEGLAIATMP